jgi:hypothetical protein
MADIPPIQPTSTTEATPPTNLRIIGGRQGPRKGKISKLGGKLSRRTLENLSPKMLEIRNKFISEFLRDWNGPMAYIRAGGPATTATKMASEFLREPYVSSRIWEVIDSMEEAELITRKRVIAMLVREANYMAIGASHGARVAALGKLSTILGMDQVNINVHGEVDHNIRGGVMLVPMTSPKDWERLAGESQKQLKEEVRK